MMHDRICSVEPLPECVEEFGKLKNGREWKYLIFKITDDKKKIFVEEKSADKDWEVFADKLRNAVSCARPSKSRYSAR